VWLVRPPRIELGLRVPETQSPVRLNSCFVDKFPIYKFCAIAFQRTILRISASFGHVLGTVTYLMKRSFPRDGLSYIQYRFRPELRRQAKQYLCLKRFAENIHNVTLGAVADYASLEKRTHVRIFGDPFYQGVVPLARNFNRYFHRCFHNGE